MYVTGVCCFKSLGYGLGHSPNSSGCLATESHYRMTHVSENTPSQNPSSLLWKLFERLGIEGGERLSTLSKGQTSSLAVGTVKTADQLTQAEWNLKNTNYWIGVNPMNPSAMGRGKAEDVIRLTGLYADLDVKSNGFASKQDALRFVDHLSEILGTNPAAIIHSGNGVQPIWALENGDVLTNSKAQSLLAWFGCFVQGEAVRTLGFKPDSVFDLARVLRVPGTFNLKDPANPKEAGLGLPTNYRPLAVTEVVDLLGGRSVPMPSSEKQSGPVVPLKDWPVGETCQYVKTMIASWPSDIPTAGRHQWAASQTTRLIAALRLGCVSRADFSKSAEIIQDRLKEMRDKGISGEAGPTDPDEVADLAKWAVASASSRPSSEIKAELGDHSHAGDDEEANRENIDELVEAIKRDRSTRSASGTPIDELEPITASDTEFWESRPFLKWINQLARENMTVPTAVLGAFLARYAAELPPGTRTSTGACLNLYVGLYGRSGTGKSTAMRAVKQCGVEWEASGGVPGSGEGVGRYFAGFDPATKSFIVKNTNAYFEMDEISTLLGAKARAGNTLEGVLNSAFVGESLQITYGSQEKSFKVDSYSMSIVAGVQPGIADEVATRTETGFAQRFLWVKSTDMTMDDKAKEKYHEAAKLKAEGNPLSAKLAPKIELTPKRYVVQVPGEISRGIATERINKLTTDDLLDVSTTEGNHDTLIRLKVAALFALIDNRSQINDQDWLYAGRLVANSLEIRGSIKKAAIIEQDKANEATGKREAKIKASRDRNTVEDLTRRVLQYARNNRTLGEFASYRTFRGSIATTKEDRAMFGAVMDSLFQDGTFSKRKVGRQHQIAYLGDPTSS